MVASNKTGENDLERIQLSKLQGIFLIFKFLDYSKSRPVPKNRPAPAIIYPAMPGGI
jgi:hypothetical protein